MNSLQIPRVILSGHRCGAGKSLLTIGLSVALRKKNVSLSCCIGGSDAVQAMVLKRLTRRNVRSLDFNLLTNNQVLISLKQASTGADILLIEGREGLFDGAGPGSFKGSDAELAALSRTPVVLIVDSMGLNNSLAALIKGYSEFAQGFEVAAVIANFCDFDEGADDLAQAELPRDKIYYDSALQSFGMKPLLGAVPHKHGKFPAIQGRFSQRTGGLSLPLQFFKDAGRLAEKYIDLEAFIDIANTAPELRLPESVFEPANRRTRIAVSDDTCFSFGFQDNIDLLRYHGAEIVPFSPLADEDLPKRIGAVYLTGGAIGNYAEELARNSSIKDSLLDFVRQGGVLFSEGAGSAYLCQQFQGGEDQGFYPGVGILKGKAVYEPGYFTYNESITVEDSILGRAGLVFKALSVGEWRLESPALLSKVIRISSSALTSYDEGYSPEAQVVSTFSFPHFASAPSIAKNLVDASEIVAKVS